MVAVVVGLGVMGAAAAAELAARGVEVVGLDRWSPPHDRGSSHGRTRVFRTAYFEHPTYVPLLEAAAAGWRRWEEASGRELLRMTGGVFAGPADAPVVAGSRRSAEHHGLAHELLDAAEVAHRFPPLRLPDHHVAVYEPAAGVVFCEDAVAALLALAEDRGATIRTGVEVRAIHTDPAEVTVETADGTRTAADRVVVAAGAWLDRLLPVAVTVERQYVGWFHPPLQLPVFVWQPEDLAVPLYGMPDLRGWGTKVAFHHGGTTGEVDRLPREVTAEEVTRLAAATARLLPGVQARPHTTQVCWYTNTADGHFVIGPSPADARIVIAGGFSGHGFKFAPVVGRAVADLICDGGTDLDLTLFDPRRVWRAP